MKNNQTNCSHFRKAETEDGVIKCMDCGIEPNDCTNMQTPDTPQLSPIEKAIAELEESYPVMGVNYVIEKLQSLRPYEKQYLRDVAEKAWDAAENTTRKPNSPDFETYMNQNHPL